MGQLLFRQLAVGDRFAFDKCMSVIPTAKGEVVTKKSAKSYETKHGNEFGTYDLAIVNRAD